MGIFDSDIFTLASLTAAINEVQYVPSQIGQAGLFEAEGISTTSLVIEKDGDTLGLVENKPRGAPGTVVGADKRTGVSFHTAHLPTTATINADEVQNVRTFGSEDQEEAVQAVVNRRLAKMARRIDMTHEHHKLGAIMGKVLDSDGATVIYDLFQTFGMTQQTVAMALDTAGTEVKGKSLDIHEKVEEALGGLSYTGITVRCGKSFWRKLITHSKVKEAYERYQAGAQLREDPREGFMFGGIFWERYRGGGPIKIADTEAYASPEGVMDLFISRFAPGDYMDTVNTLGLPFYASSEPLDHNKGVSLEAQSNPAHLCTRPKVNIKLYENTAP
ncbi:major capsid protein [Halomonas sp. I1]|uniref:major capsid protein n=1 Tax=Halomonas sp. I1 TaxID=393536 RepID=UPI0028DF1A0F|nr:major capsid protein [Halomonas sp. I1]MDT8895476.1 major capsid protein [Halomonas sp. I1]